MKQLPSHTAFNVIMGCDNTAGIISPKASTMFGPTTEKPMLCFRDAAILLVDNRLYRAYKNELEQAKPVHTAMKVIILNVPLGEIIDKDGFVEIKYDGITERIQVDKKLWFDAPGNLMKPRQLIKCEQGWQTTCEKGVYVTRMLEGKNDQM